MSAPPLAPAKSLLARHRVLAPTAAVHVSPICLGAMNFGTAWKSIMGECSKDTAFEMIDYFFEQGGNFIDTSVSLNGGHRLWTVASALTICPGQMAIKPKNLRHGWGSG